MNKVTFTGNILRFLVNNPKRTNQIGNIEWISNLLSPIFNNYLSIQTDKLIWNESSKFNSRVIFDLHGFPLTESGLVNLLFEEPKDQVCEYLQDHLKGTSLIIGYELPLFIIKAVEKINIPYVDIILAPWRFMPDLAFGIRTNVPSIFLKLWKNRLTEAEIASYAGLIRAEIARLPLVDLSSNSCLFAGQVGNDMSLLKNRRFMQLEDFEEKLTEISYRYTKLYFKEHPYCSPNELKQQRKVIKKFKNHQIINENIYYLMAHPAVNSIYSITSSVTQEAKYFDTYSECFSEYPFIFSKNSIFEKTSFVPIYDRLLQPNFWVELLDFDLQFDYLNVPIGALRKSLRLSWGMETSKLSSNKNFFKKSYLQELKKLTRFLHG